MKAKIRNIRTGCSQNLFFLFYGFGFPVIQSFLLSLSDYKKKKYGNTERFV